MPADPAVWGLATIVMTSSLSATSTFLPPLVEVRKRDQSDKIFAGDVRLGELATMVVSIGFGAVCSSLSGSPVPAMVGLLTGLGLAALYESALKQDASVGNG